MIRIVVLGKVLQVPENNLLLRQMQFVSADIGYGRYCWNGECRYCEILYHRAEGGPEQSALACRVKGFEGMVLTKVATEIKYNLSECLAAAPAAEPKPDA